MPTRNRFRVDGHYFQNQETTVVFSDEQPKAKVLLTNQPDQCLGEPDMQLALSQIALNAIFAGVQHEGGAKQALEEALTSIRENRRKSSINRLFLVIELSHDIEHNNLTNVADCSPYFFDADLQQRLKEKDTNFVLGCGGNIALSEDRITALTKCGESFSVEHPSGRPVYLFQGISVSVSPTVSGPVKADLADLFATQLQSVRFRDKQQTVLRLLVSSLGTERDNLRAFLFCWTALEIFVQKSFAEFEDQLANLFQNGIPDSITALLSQNVTLQKNTLVDRFIFVSFVLGGSDSLVALPDFRSAKTIRDHFLHGKEIPDATLPTGTVRSILKNLLQLYPR